MEMATQVLIAPTGQRLQLDISQFHSYVRLPSSIDAVSTDKVALLVWTILGQLFLGRPPSPPLVSLR